eukprot:Gb_14001 [translate_table: standard]
MQQSTLYHPHTQHYESATHFSVGMKMESSVILVKDAIGKCEPWHLSMAVLVLMVGHYIIHRKEKGPRYSTEWLEHLVYGRFLPVLQEANTGPVGFMQLKDDNGCLYPDKASRDFIVSLILAARDTTPVALSWFFWLLHHHPEEMKYLHASLSEATRLYPPVPIILKEAMHDDVLPNGTPVSKGSKIMYFIYSTGRMENVWGNDCCDFKPQRWLKNGVFVSEPTCKYAVFNPGPRLCLGKDLAYTQMKTVAAAIIWRFHVRVVSGHPVVPRFGLTLIMKHGLLVTLHRITRRRQPAQTCLSDLTRSS